MTKTSGLTAAGILGRKNSGKFMGVRMSTISKILFLAFTVLLVLVFLMPIGYGIVNALKSDSQIATANAPLLPSSQETFTHNGKDLDVVMLPSEEGKSRPMALLKKGRTESQFIDPRHPDNPPVVWEGNWRNLEVVWVPDFKWGNFIKAWTTIDFIRLLRNTLMYAFISTFGAVFSAALVGYGFSRFSFPGKRVLFLIVMATIILPPSVTLIPTYAFFNSIGWVGTWLPIIIPSLFGNGYNIFLLRQFFMGIPKELDEAARIDGAHPFQIFFLIVLPQAIPALTAVSLFHFFYCWNDFMGPLIYLSGKPELFPITVGLTAFNGLYSQQVNMIQASSIISAAIPFIIFLFAQRIFLQGVQIGGIDK